ncbi:MAG: DUF1996 domain-containing protein [Acidimicrobiales bacterium]|nr:DUF1996 domain-containing protein [Acidimicrobiales bacterium]
MTRRARRARVCLLVALAFAVPSLVSCGDSGAGAQGPPERVGPTIAATEDSAVFTVDCGFSHRAPDDPIVFPGEPGASHVHDFFGAEETDAHSTAASLRGGPTSCEDLDDTAAYWAPALYDGDRPVDPTRMRAYYRAAAGADVHDVRTLPAGIELIAGDMHRGPGDWPPIDQVGWGCGFRPKRYRHTPPTNCTPRSPLNLRLVFPDCWNGKDLRSDDHYSHVAYSTNGWCPRSHPVPIVQVQVSIEYPVWAKEKGGPPATDASKLMLASGRFEGSHGDFFNSWDPKRLDHLTTLCVRAMANCTIG